jgi:5-methylthioadenosine/S-adenosylhomocysteine deaminase
MVNTGATDGSSWLIRGARMLDDHDGSRPGEPIDVRLRDGRIARIAPGGTLATTPDEQVLDAPGRLLLPGLVNAHFHSTGTFNRSFVENLPLELFMLYELPPFDFGPFPAELYRTQALWATAQMLKVGVTSVMDDAIFYPAPSADAVDGLMGAYRDAGIRATVALYLPDRVEYEWVPGLKDLLPSDVVERMDREAIPTDALVATHEAFVDRWNDHAQGRLRCAVSCSAPQRATDEYLRRLHALARQRDLPFVFHIYESKLQRASANALYGTSMIRHLRNLGVLDQRSVAVHAVWVDDQDIADLAACGATVVHSPAGNLRCGDGVMPYRQFRTAGVPVALCTDEATVEDRCNLWNVGRLAGMLQTLGGPTYTGWPKATELFEALTVHGARCFGLAGQLGVVREGALADIILLDLDAVLDAPLARLVNALVYGEDGSSVRDVFVGGRRVVRDGEITTIDLVRLGGDVRRLGEQWAEAVRPVERWAERLAPVYRAIYERFAHADIGINRWVGDEGTWLWSGER